ncbi:hypothetical protein CVT25_002689 [Psilocybe cyanescens]|uniref:Uncharacterized protein n=1 Tax=Psilocybe cyanescens TaxID=93625 RepID=A0A409WLM1_PSICY|nr:hypothetical protein CVT25_002689 [Psilocybe cyanescens]
MSDFPLDDQLNTPPISPAPSDNTLDVLCTLNPLSPDLTPTQLTFNQSSGHIPFLLYDEDYVEPVDLQRFSISDFSLASVNAGHVDGSGLCIPAVRPSSVSNLGSSAASIISAGSRLSRDARASTTDSVYLGLDTLDSSNTISSVGTFGPKRKSRRQSAGNTDASPSRPDSFSLSQTFPSSVSLSRGSVATDQSSVVFNHKRSPTATNQNLSGIFASPSVLSDGNGKRASLVARMDSFNANSTKPVLDSPTRRTNIVAHNAGPENETSFTFDDQEDGDIDSEPTTPPKAIPKTISWISSRDWDYKQYKDYVAQEGSYPMPRSPSPVNDIEVGNTTISPRRRAPARINAMEHRDLNVIVETPRASQFAREIQEYRPESPVQGGIPHSASHKLSLRHNEHNWLRDVALQFLVDQEGFRAAHPLFRFTGVARIRPTQNSKASLIVMAQFRPVTRQAFHFHYAPFESPPILRRVTVNFDETHDYLSKQALLTLKNNGVYVLHGHEMSQPTPEGESLKLYWQFEYLIDDRRVETSGRIMEGEKIMTPLTFSCVPALLLPGQGKRNSIMHVFKKGVAPKLVAERLQPPGISTTPKKTTTDPQVAETVAPVANFFSSKAHAWNIHKRGQSHGIHTTNTQKHAQPNFPSVYEQESQDIDPKSPSAHRRASFGGENHKHAITPPRFDTLTSSANKYPGVSFETPVPSRHIIPPQKLAELLDAPGSPERPNAHRPPSIRNSSQFAPLTPRPRQANNARDPSHIR